MQGKRSGGKRFMSLEGGQARTAVIQPFFKGWDSDNKIILEIVHFFHSLVLCFITFNFDIEGLEVTFPSGSTVKLFFWKTIKKNSTKLILGANQCN